jgi:quinoprotein glucose dehydrogenase
MLGLIIAVGGAWLIALGGSWYYLIAGFGLIATGVLMVLRRIESVWIYLATWLFTLIWAYAEVGLNGWALVPRVVAPTIILLLVLFSIPALRLPSSRRLTPGYVTVAGIGLLLLLSGSLRLHLVQPAQAETAIAPSSTQAQPPHSSPSSARLALSDSTPGKNSATQAGSAAATPSSAARADTAAPGANVATIADTSATMSKTPGEVFQAGKDWPAYGGSKLGTRYSPLGEITPQNVSRLEKVWTYRSGDMPSSQAKDKYASENTPLKVGSHLFLCSAKDIIISVDAASGKEEWRYDPKVSDAAIPYSATCRSVAYYEVPNAKADETCATRILEGTLDARLIAVDAKNGRLCAGFGHQGVVDLNEGIGETVPGWYAVTSAPTIVRGIAVVGGQVKDGQAVDAPSGVIRGYDAVTGKLAWAWDMGHPDRTGAPPAGETYTRGTPNMWTTAAGDEKLGYVYIPLGNAAVDYYGALRKPFENDYNSSLVAIDVTTGKPVWHFQTVHYDLWDYDLGSQPSLVDLPVQDGTVPAIIIPSKQGQIYALDRRTGKSLFPVKNNAVPSDGLEAQNLSKAQPYSGYAHLDQKPLTEKDMWGMSPIDQLWCRIQFKRATYDGEYTAPTVNHPYIEYPGYNGGSDWGSVAVDAKRGILVANYNDMPNFNWLIPRKKADKLGYKSIIQGGNDKAVAGKGDPQAGSPYAIRVNAGWQMPTGLLCKQPPYGHIRAIDLKTGKTLWDHPLGSARKNGPFGIPSMLPITIGTPNNGGPLVTAGGLIFIAATTDDMLRAIDISTGKVVWQTELPAGGQATPMTYEVDGRQYVAIAPGGHHFMKTKIGDYLVAYALPKGK